MIWHDCQEEIKDSCTGNGIFYFCKVSRSPAAHTHQETIEEFMDTEAQHADQHVRYMVEKGHVHNDGSVASSECATVSNKAHQKYYFVTKLGGDYKTRFTTSEQY